jgi:hypothetical protein
MAVLEVAEGEDIPTGTDLTQIVITTPVATPMGMRTYGLDIVVKFDTFLSLARSDILSGFVLLVFHLSIVTACDASSPLSISYSSQDHILTT